SDQAVYPAHLDILLDPHDPAVQSAAAAAGLSATFIDAAGRSPVYQLIKAWKLALPLHPEFRTLPMVWYIPPLSPVSGQVESSQEQEAIDAMRIPITYLANLLTAGDEAPVRLALKRLSAVRQYMRAQRVEGHVDEQIPAAVGISADTIEKMYRLLALARLEERFVLPTAPVKEADIFIHQGTCGFGEAL
ncbi:MAG: nitrate reductase subunit beta, partial [Desulfobacterales bacterium]